MEAQVRTSPVIEQAPRREPAVEASIWSVLQQAAMSQMAELINALQEIAPQPGSLVYVEARRPSYDWNGWQPILFSAIDLCTHLQIGRMYLMPTQASAIDFLHFIAEQYPFPLNEVHTSADPVFMNSVSTLAQHQFTSEARKIGVLHTMVLDQSNHPILRVVSKYLFGGTFEGSVEKTSEEKVVAALVNFLFFNNNHRSLATLGDLTPLQKLNLFPGYDKISWFDPYRPVELRKTGNNSR